MAAPRTECIRPRRRLPTDPGVRRAAEQAWDR
jgi:hypothetical protein